MLCLEIPVPRCIQNLACEPPVCWPSEEDIEVLNLLRQFGTEFRRPRDEIEQACSLASGPSNLVIILERPHKNQEYSVSFEKFVEKCPTLKAVDELIRFGSKGARSIHTITVLDAFSFKPQNSTPIPSERCHQLIEQILKLKKPKVVLCCWNKDSEHPFVAQFKSRGVGTWPFRHQVDIEGISTIVIRSFHPAAAVCYDESRKACCRTLLICHFALAFAELAGPMEVPEWIHTVCNDSLVEHKISRDNGSRSPSDLEKTAIILRILRRLMGAKRGRKQKRVLHSEGEHQRQEVNALLRQVFTSNYNKGARDIAQLCLLWKDYKYYQPSTRQDILSRLGELGSRQDLFQAPGVTLSYYVGIADDDDDYDLDKQLASLQIQENASSVDEELVALARLRTQLFSQKEHLERLENVASEILSRVQLSAKLRISISSPDRIDIRRSIAELAKDMNRELVEATRLITATRSILVGEEGVIRHKDQPRRFLAQRPNARNIIDPVMLGVESLANLAFRCLLLLSGLLAQGRILYSPSQRSNDDVSEAFFEATNDLGQSASIKSTLDTLPIFLEQLDNPNQLFKLESHTE